MVVPSESPIWKSHTRVSAVKVKLPVPLSPLASVLVRRFEPHELCPEGLAQKVVSSTPVLLTTVMGTVTEVAAAVVEAAIYPTLVERQSVAVIE